MEKHINSVLSSCYFHIKALRHIRRSLTDKVAGTIARCIVLSRIDYCNSLLYGAPSKYLNKLQRVQNSLARIVLNRPFRSSAAPLLRELHWLPVCGTACSFQDCFPGLPMLGRLSAVIPQRTIVRKSVCSRSPIGRYISPGRATNQDRRRFPCVQFGGTPDLEQFGR